MNKKVKIIFPQFTNLLKQMFTFPTFFISLIIINFLINNNVCPSPLVFGQNLFGSHTDRHTQCLIYIDSVPGFVLMLRNILLAPTLIHIILPKPLKYQPSVFKKVTIEGKKERFINIVGFI